MQFIETIKYELRGIIIPCIIGICSLVLRKYTQQPILDPLVISLLIGILVRTFIKFDTTYMPSLKIALSVFIPVGVVFYGAVNLNFLKYTTVDINYIFILLMVMFTYTFSSLLLSRLFKLNEKTGYLIATGSAICGASAIAIASKAIDAEPDDISNSLISVFITALLGLFIILPLLTILFKISDLDYGIFSGSVLQFTGFVKVAVSSLSKATQSVALTVKATRYIALLFLIPLFASFGRGRMYIPWFLWAFLGAGIFFSFSPELYSIMRPAMKFLLDLLWSIAMAAIGLNVNLRNTLTANSLKALIVSFISFLLAICCYFLSTRLF